jgi:hypothetical protein
MPFKLDANGNIVTQEVNGQKLPVFVHPDGKEAAFDADSTIATIGRLNGEAKGHRERAEAAEGKLKGFDGITDVQAALKALTTVKNLDEKNLIAAGDRDKAVSEAVKSVEEKYAPIVKQAEELRGQLNSHLIGSAFSGSKFIAEKFAAPGPAGVEMARALFEKSFKVEDGKLVAYGSDGNKIYSRTRHGELASAEEAIELLVDGYAHKAHILKGSGAQGGGAQGGGQGGKRSYTRAQFDALSPAERMTVSQAVGKGEAVLTD